MIYVTLIISFLISMPCSGSDLGCAYRDGYNAVMLTPHLASRQLTDQEMDDADKLPGGGYNDGKWSGENPPTGTNDEGNPTYAVQYIFEGEDTIFILEDDGKIVEVEIS